MSLIITSIIIKTPHLADMLDFYQNIGFQFKTLKVEKGSEVHRAFNNGVEFCLYSSVVEQGLRTPSLQLGFKVTDLEKIVSCVCQVKGAMVILDPTDMPDGKKAIILDPDGHAVELTEI